MCMHVYMHVCIHLHLNQLLTLHSCTDGQYVCLESVKYPGQHVGVLPDGSVKPPHQTGKGPHGRFIASALSAVSASPGHLVSLPWTCMNSESPSSL